MSETALSIVAEPANGFALFAAPTNLNEAKAAAEMLAQSNFVPTAFKGKPGDIMVAAAMGARLGLDVFSSLSGISVINGRPTIWGDAMLAVCQQSKDWADIEERIEGDGDKMTAITVVHRKDRKPYTGQFSIADAKQAGLLGKQGPWMQYPKRMFQMRARAIALRGLFADRLAGFHAREELDDADMRTVESVVVPEPVAGKKRGPKPKTEQQEPATATGAPAVQQAGSTPLFTNEQPDGDDEPVVIEGDIPGQQTLADAGAPIPPTATPPAPEPAKPVSVDDILKVVMPKWQQPGEVGDKAKAAIRKVLTAWKLNKVPDLAGHPPEDRVKFLADIQAAFKEAKV